MRIVIATSEVTPFAKTGGLAEVCGALPRALVKLGVKVSVFTPLYSISQNLSAKSLRLKLLIKVGERIKPAAIHFKRQAKIDFFFVGEKEYFDREFLYGSEHGDYPDNAQRFIFFSKAVIESLIQLNIKPAIIHCHDWQTALIPLYLKTIYAQSPILAQTKTVFTIHNLGYQGIFPEAAFYDIGVSEKFFSPQGIEFYGKVNFLKAGLLFADLLTTVSPTYAQEIQTKEFGFGLEGVLADRKDHLFGILNGIDDRIWNPAKDKYIKPNYDARTSSIKKKIIKHHLGQKLKLNLTPETPLIGFIGRLTEQKGIELIIDAVKTLLKNQSQKGKTLSFVILGIGEEKYHKLLLELASQFPHQLSVTLGFNEPLAHQIYAGSDIFLIPSRYEPCGLAQMIALKYGSIPIGFKTGGLADTIIDYSLDSANGNGFLFSPYETNSLIAKLKMALALFNQKEEWLKLIQRAMAANFSNEASAQAYLELYSKLQKISP